MRANLARLLLAAFAFSGPLALPREALASAQYVIVTTNAIRDGSRELENFVQHKIWKGFTVRVVTEDDYEPLTGPAPNGRAEKIRRWLQVHRADEEIRYVLLVGNPDPDDPMFSEDYVGDVPMKQVWHSLAATPTAGAVVWWGDATDRYYADLDGDWDANGDGFYGVSPWIAPGQELLSPLPAGVNVSGFSARWEGSLTLAAGRSVQFDLGQWEGARLFVDGALIMDQWPRTKKYSDTRRALTLGAGTHTVVVEYFESTGRGHLVLKADGNDMTGFTGSYYPNTTLSGAPAGVVANQKMRFSWEQADHVSRSPGLVGVNFEEEVSVGRIPVYDDDHEHLDGTLRALMAYERELPAWRRKVLLPMEPLDASTPLWDLGEAIVDFLPGDFTPFRIYEQNYGLSPQPEMTPANPTNLVSAWNRGFGVVTWGTHGHWRYAADLLDAKYQVRLLTAPERPVTFQSSCGTGSIYVPDCYPGCAATFADPNPDALGHPDARVGLTFSLLGDHTIANVAATEVATYTRGPFSPNSDDRTNNNQLAYSFTRALTVDDTAFGDALSAISFTPHFAVDGAESYFPYHNQLIFNLFGDPAMQLTAVPGNRYPVLMPLPVSSTIQSGDGVSFDLAAVDPEGDPLIFGDTGLPPGATWDSGGRSVTWTPSWEQIGDHDLGFWVSDTVNPGIRSTRRTTVKVRTTPFACSFTDGGERPEMHWQSVAGRWRAAMGRFLPKGRGWNRALIRSAWVPGAATGVYSALLRLPPAGALRNAALLFAYQGAKAHRSATLTPAGVTVRDTAGSPTLLPAPVGAGAWHRLEIRLLSAAKVEVLLDGESLGIVDFGFERSGRLGLAAKGTRGQFDDVTYTALP